MLRQDTGMEEAQQAWKRNTAATEARGVDQLKHVQNVIVDICSGFEVRSVAFDPTGEKLVCALGFVCMHETAHMRGAGNWVFRRHVADHQLEGWKELKICRERPHAQHVVLAADPSGDSAGQELV